MKIYSQVKVKLHKSMKKKTSLISKTITSDTELSRKAKN